MDTNKVIVWAIIENIVLLILVGFVFWLTRSAWVFLLLILINSPKTRVKIDMKKKENNERNNLG